MFTSYLDKTQWVTGPSRGAAPRAFSTITGLLGVSVPQSHHQRSTIKQFFVLHCELSVDGLSRAVTISRPAEDRVEVELESRYLHDSTFFYTTRTFTLLPDDTVHAMDDWWLSAEEIEGVVQLLSRLGADRVTFLDEMSRKMGRCCWCHRPVSRAKSLRVGAGSVCHKRHHEPTAKEILAQRCIREQLEKDYIDGVDSEIMWQRVGIK